MATDPRLELRYQGLQALNIIFLSAIRLSSNLKVTDLVTNSKEKTISDASLKDDYVFIFDSNFANLSGSDDTSQTLKGVDKSLFKIDEYIGTYLAHCKEAGA